MRSTSDQREGSILNIYLHVRSTLSFFQTCALSSVPVQELKLHRRDSRLAATASNRSIGSAVLNRLISSHVHIPGYPHLGSRKRARQYREQGFQLGWFLSTMVIEDCHPVIVSTTLGSWSSLPVLPNLGSLRSGRRLSRNACTNRWVSIELHP